MYSREQLVRLALSDLGAVGAGQSPSAEDAKTIDDKINSVMDDLARRNVWTWGDPDQIEDAAALHLAALLANASARDFGKAPDETVRMLAEQRLRELNVQTLSGQPQTVDYF